MINKIGVTMGSGPQQTGPGQRSGAATRDAASNATSGADQVSLTPAAERLQALVREDGDGIDLQRVAELRRQIDDGTYDVDSLRVAVRMLEIDQGLFGTDR